MQIDSMIQEITYELNGSLFLVGNRVLSILNLNDTGMTEEGLRALAEAVAEQEFPDNCQNFGLYKLSATVSQLH